MGRGQASSGGGGSEGWEELQAGNLGLGVWMSTRIRGLGISQSRAESARLWKWRSDKKSGVRSKVLGSSGGACRLGFRNQPKAAGGKSTQSGVTDSAGVPTHPRRSAEVLGSGPRTTASCRLGEAEHAEQPWRTHTNLEAESSRLQNRSAPDPRLGETEAEGTDG